MFETKFIPFKELSEMLYVSETTLRTYIERPELKQFVEYKKIRQSKDTRGRTYKHERGINAKDFPLFKKIFTYAFDRTGKKTAQRQAFERYKQKEKNYVTDTVRITY